jgi:hypothetical protein
VDGAGVAAGKDGGGWKDREFFCVSGSGGEWAPWWTASAPWKDREFFCVCGCGGGRLQGRWSSPAGGGGREGVVVGCAGCRVVSADHMKLRTTNSALGDFPGV